MEVMTELLISMMSQDSNLARVMANNAFACLSEYFTPASVKIIMDVSILLLGLIINYHNQCLEKKHTNPAH